MTIIIFVAIKTSRCKIEIRACVTKNRDALKPHGGFEKALVMVQMFAFLEKVYIYILVLVLFVCFIHL